MAHYVLDDLNYTLDHVKGTLTTKIVDHVQDAPPGTGVELESNVWIPAGFDKFLTDEPRPYAQELKKLVLERAKLKLNSTT